jgi:hypothetical protein
MGTLVDFPTILGFLLCPLCSLFCFFRPRKIPVYYLLKLVIVGFFGLMIVLGRSEAREQVEVSVLQFFVPVLRHTVDLPPEPYGVVDMIALLFAHSAFLQRSIFLRWSEHVRKASSTQRRTKSCPYIYGLCLASLRLSGIW